MGGAEAPRSDFGPIVVRSHGSGGKYGGGEAVGVLYLDLWSTQNYIIQRITMQSKTFVMLCAFVAKLKGSRSPWGREWAARIMTVIQTCRLQNISPWALILDAVNAQNLRSQPPSLLLSIS